MSELEKLVVAIATAIFIFIFSDNIGRLIYGPYHFVKQQGYLIEVHENQEVAQSTGLPAILDMNLIMSKADVEKGGAIFKRVCTLCHTGDENGVNKVGPNLWGIYNNHAAHKDDFNYSEAMLARKATGVLWNEEELYRYLFAPKQYVVGTKMSFAGLKDDKERADLIAYLKTLSSVQ